MRRTRLYLLASLLVVLASSLWPLERSDLSVFIRFFDKKIYYLDKTDDIRIKVTITNNALEAVRLKVADDKVFNMDFEVKTPANVMLDHSKEFTIDRSSYQYVLFKDIVLEPEEEYGFIVDLDRYIEIDRAGSLSVQAFFYPSLPPDSEPRATPSNTLSLNLRPPLLAPAAALVEEESGAVMKQEPWPPDEVVAYTIRSRQASQWEKFFLYLDLPRLLRQNPDWSPRYDRSSAVERLELVEEYKRELQSETVDQDILVIPDTFEIVRTSYTPFDGAVEVLMKFEYRDYTEVKQYTYYVERRELIWLITDYGVTNLGTE